MMPMGTWYVATLLAQQKSGDADTFNWGIAPAPQFDTSHDRHLDRRRSPSATRPASAINAAINDGDKLTVAKAFLAYAAGPEGARRSPASASRRPTRPTRSCRRYFSLTGVPTDDLSKFAWSTHDIKPENPVSKYTAGLQNILNALHSAVLSGSKTDRRRDHRRREPGQEHGPQPVTVVRA